MKSWSTMSDRSKTLTLMADGVQVSLAVTAWTDLARDQPKTSSAPELCGQSLSASTSLVRSPTSGSVAATTSTNPATR